MSGISIARLAAAVTIALLAAPPVKAEVQLRCGPFNSFAEPPEPRKEPDAINSFRRINIQVKTQLYRVLYFGDSITERWNMPLWGAKKVWDANMPQRGVLNAGVSGDRTEHLRWRLDHGNLDGPAPKLVLLMIGTNDLGHGRPPNEAAEGVRKALIRLREKLPNSKILLFGLTPRGAAPWEDLRVKASQVNQMIGGCADGQTIWATDISGPLLDAKGMLGPTIAPDYLHFNAAGYEKLAPQVDNWIDQLAGKP